jgi:hypothetical protein
LPENGKEQLYADTYIFLIRGFQHFADNVLAHLPSVQKDRATQIPQVAGCTLIGENRRITIDRKE